MNMIVKKFVKVQAKKLLYKRGASDDKLSDIMEMLESGKLTLHKGRIYVNSFMPIVGTKGFFTLLKDLEEIRPGHGIPIYTDIAVTQQCPYNCWHCSYKERESGQQLSTSHYMRILDELVDLKGCIVGFTGGEPLTNPDLEKLIAHVDGRMGTLLLTTGYSLTYDRAVALKEAGLDIPVISLDHYTEEVHDKLRGYKGAFRNALNAINLFKKAGFYVVTTMAPTKEIVNADSEIDTYLQFARDIGVNEVRIAAPSLSGNLLKKSGSKFGSSEHEFLQNVSIEYNKRKGFPTVSAFSLIESKEMFGCGAGFHFCFVDHMGNVCPCDVSPLRFGNIRDMSLREAWENMSSYFKCPRGDCYANVINEAVSAKNSKLPLSWEDSIDIVTKLPSTKIRFTLPKLYDSIGFGDYHGIN